MSEAPHAHAAAHQMVEWDWERLSSRSARASILRTLPGLPYVGTYLGTYVFIYLYAHYIRTYSTTTVPKVPNMKLDPALRIHPEALFLRLCRTATRRFAN